MSSKYVKSLINYANNVVSGKTPACIHVKNACKRHLNDLKKAEQDDYPYYFSDKAADHVCSFAEMLPHVKGKWVGGNIVLEPWQCFILGVAFGWLRKSDNFRRFREVMCLIPRKNGKSVLGAIIGLYMFCMDGEEGAEVYSGASTEKQALEVFRPAWMMAQKLPALRDAFGIELGGSHKNPGNIYSMATNSRFEAVVGKPGDGASVHCGIIDEYHEHKSPELYDTMSTGAGARTQPMIVTITTAGSDYSGPCYDKMKHVEKVIAEQDGFINDELFGIIYTIDDDDRWDDFDNWYKANPNFGVSVFEDFLRSQHKEAIQRVSTQNTIRTKHLNQWVSVGSAFFNIFDWDCCKDETMSEDDFKGCDCWIGLDLASKVDIAAKMKLFKKNDEFYVFGSYYLPEDAAEGNDRNHYITWHKQGWLTLTDGARINLDWVEEDIIADSKKHQIIEVCNDPWNAQMLIDHLQKQKIPVIEIPQTVNYLSGPMKELDALIRSKKIHHNGDPVLKWMISNTMGKYDKKDNVFPYKDKEINKIDGVVALIMAIGRAMVSVKKVSKYERESLAFV
jgi:phage terminase large subunit-like protein